MLRASLSNFHHSLVESSVLFPVWLLLHVSIEETVALTHDCWMLQEVLDVHRISFIEVLFYLAVALLQKYKTSCADKVFDSVKSQLIQVLSFPRWIDRCFRERYFGNSRKFFTKAWVTIGWPIDCRLKGINFVRHLDRSSTNFRRLVSCYSCQVSSRM